LFDPFETSEGRSISYRASVEAFRTLALFLVQDCCGTSHQRWAISDPLARNTVESTAGSIHFCGVEAYFAAEAGWKREGWIGKFDPNAKRVTCSIENTVNNNYCS